MSRASVAGDVVLERPRISRIHALRAETGRHATFAFHDPACAAAAPGAFCMVWVPGVDEVPMGLGPTDADGHATLTVEAKGDCTKAMLALGEGGHIGVRGPYGRGFDLPAQGHAVFLGGGTGIAPMARGAQAARAAGLDVTVISGARSKDMLLLDGFLRAQDRAGGMRYHPCTDDGSHGFHGLTTQMLEALLQTGPSPDYVAACGPEPMMVRAVEICRTAEIPCEASLERYMKCATGICDACTLGPGWRVCVEGPVFDSGQLQEIPEFGVGHRDAAGVLHPW